MTTAERPDGTRYLSIDPVVFQANSPSAFRGMLDEIRRAANLSCGQIAVKAGIPRSQAYALVDSKRDALPSKRGQILSFLTACNLETVQIETVLDLWYELSERAAQARAGGTTASEAETSSSKSNVHLVLDEVPSRSGEDQGPRSPTPTGRLKQASSSAGVIIRGGSEVVIGSINSIRWTTVVFALLLMLAAAGATGWLLWSWIDSMALADPETRASATLDSVKVAASVALGCGGLFTLYLAARRQRSHELELSVRNLELMHREAELAQRDRAQEDERQDAAARRVTELYTKATEQLGSDKAPVRLAGLYALERLAQDNRAQRQTVVDVLCAYLRMPFTPPETRARDAVDERIPTHHEERMQEREVRLTAQRVLQSHLVPGDDSDDPIVTYWPDIDLDLTGATLIDFDLSHCRPRHTMFNGATFAGPARFNGVTFTGSARFVGATFDGLAVFVGALFVGAAMFNGATFTGPARFDNTTCAGAAVFGGATFTGPAKFSGTSFADTVVFHGATFIGITDFIDAAVLHPSARSTWPPGLRPSDEHQPLADRDGTWHKLQAESGRSTG